MSAFSLAYESNNLMIHCVTRAGGPQAGYVSNIGKLCQPDIRSHEVRHVDTRTDLIYQIMSRP